MTVNPDRPDIEIPPGKDPFPGFDIRYTEVSDAQHLKEWLSEPAVARWFPMNDELEIVDAVNRWIGFYRYKCSITATANGVPCGMATLYLNPYKKLAHQCEFGIVVGKEYRGTGVGRELLRNLFHLAKKFGIEVIHLQVYAENPAIRLYRRMGFREFGRQTHWIKDQDVYQARLFMERFL